MSRIVKNLLVRTRRKRVNVMWWEEPWGEINVIEMTQVPLLAVNYPLPLLSNQRQGTHQLPNSPKAHLLNTHFLGTCCPSRSMPVTKILEGTDGLLSALEKYKWLRTNTSKACLLCRSVVKHGPERGDLPTWLEFLRSSMEITRCPQIPRHVQESAADPGTLWVIKPSHQEDRWRIMRSRKTSAPASPVPTLTLIKPVSN